MAEAAAAVPVAPRTVFLRNVVWGWLGVAVNIVIGLVLAPVIIHKLGAAQYGLWVLLFSTLDYLRMLDFGFRAAVVNACARARARGDSIGVNTAVSTSFVYFVGTAIIACAVPILLRDPIIDVFNVPLELRAEARLLIAIIALSVGVRLLLSPLTAALEAFQRFDVVNRAYISALIVRSMGSLALLLAGYGLIAMAWVILAAQLLEGIWSSIGLRRVVPAFSLAPSLIDRRSFAALFGYGRHSAVMVIANMFSLQAPATIIGLLRGPAEVGFFALPQRLLLYSAEAFAKVSDVTSSVTAELDEQRSRDRVWRLTVLTNRHCLALFMPVALFLWFYGAPFMELWTPASAEASAPLIPVMLIYFVFAVAGQYNSGAVLLGQARHGLFAWGIVVEVVLSIIGLVLIVPSYGIVGAAWVVTAAILLIRGVYLAILICRVNEFSLAQYLSGIYARPLAAGVPAALAAVVMTSALPGATWLELIGAGVIIAAAYYLVAFFLVLEPDHRSAVLARLRPTA